MLKWQTLYVQDHLIRYISKTRHKKPRSPYVSPNISSLRVEISSAPFGKSPLDILHQLARRDIWGDRHKQMDVIPRDVPFQDLHLIGLTEFPNQLSP